MGKKHKDYLRDIMAYIPSPYASKFTHIYFIAMNTWVSGKVYSRVKIGKADNIKKRLCSLQTGNPVRLKLWHSFRVESKHALAIEKRLHSKFKKERCLGEWFKTDRRIRTWVKTHQTVLKDKDLFIPSKEVIKDSGQSIRKTILRKKK